MPVPDTVTSQLMDQLCELGKQVARLTDEVAEVKGENNRLRQQIAGWMANQESMTTAVPVPVVESTVMEEEAHEAPLLEPVESAEPTAEEEKANDGIDEESLVELARNTTIPDKEEAEPNNGPLTDDEITKLLAEAALSAEPPQATEPEDVPVEEPEVEEVQAPVLRLEEPEDTKKVKLGFELDKETIARVPSHLAIAALAVPVRLEGNSLVCKAAAPFDQRSLDMIADATGCQVVAEEAPIEVVLAALRLAYGQEDNLDQRDQVWSVSEGESVPTKKGLKGLFKRSA